MRKFVVAAGVAVMIGGCTINIPKEDQGMVLGGILGGLGGSLFGSGGGRIVGTIAGTFAGGYLGRMIGRYMDQQDVLLHERAVEKTIVRGESSAWYNSETGHWGQVEAGRRYHGPSGYCQEYTERITIGNKVVPARGMACQERDGSWRIKN